MSHLQTLLSNIVLYNRLLLLACLDILVSLFFRLWLTSVCVNGSVNNRLYSLFCVICYPWAKSIVQVINLFNNFYSSLYKSTIIICIPKDIWKKREYEFEPKFLKFTLGGLINSFSFVFLFLF